MADAVIEGKQGEDDQDAPVEEAGEVSEDSLKDLKDSVEGNN